jgi:mRNA interferase HigB
MRYSLIVRLISNKALRDFAKIHPLADVPLQGWRRIIERGQFRNFAELKRAFNSADKVGDYFVFDIAGNNYRLIAAIHFNTQILYVRSVMTHAEYDPWRP